MANAPVIATRDVGDNLNYISDPSTIIEYIEFPDDVGDLTATYPDVQPHWNNGSASDCTQKVVWPDIIQNNVKTYLHNCAVMFNEINTDNKNNLPFKVLLKGTSSKVDKSEEYWIPQYTFNDIEGYINHDKSYYHYTHKTIHDVDKDSSYIPSDVPNKHNPVTYGKATVYYFTETGANEENGIHDYTQTIQTSINLGESGNNWYDG